jgi:NADH-quinone oxidoreductase subunit N
VSNGSSSFSGEAGLKYLVLGAVSSGLFIIGCACLYGLTADTSVQGIKSLLMGKVGLLSVSLAILFKCASAPFHMWAPDVYEGSPTITTCLMVIIPKIGVFSVLVQVGLVCNLVILCGVLSIIIGALGGLNQTKLRRLIAYSSIGHMGFIL